MSFKDIKGQDSAIDRLRSYLNSSSQSGAYLFEGEEGVGKYLTAKTFAKALNCLNKEDDACDSCLPCLKIDKGQHPDIHLIPFGKSPGFNPGMNGDFLKAGGSPGFKTGGAPLGTGDSDAIKIESIRQLKKDIGLKAYEAKEKVFIINDAHNLTPEAANALLKILEEPPPDSSIILVSSKPALIFKTIISRCRIVRFYPFKRQQLEALLKKDYGFDDTLAHFLAYFSEGRMGFALRLKDTQILSEKNRVIDEFGVLRRAAADNPQKQNKQDLRVQLNILARWFRDIYLLKIGMPHSEIINLDRKTELLSLMNRYTLFDLEEIINRISDSLMYLEQNINVKLLVSNLREDISYAAHKAA